MQKQTVRFMVLGVMVLAAVVVASFMYFGEVRLASAQDQAVGSAQNVVPVGSGPFVFTDVSATAGVSMTHSNGYDAVGQAWGDYDRDGYLDLYLTSGGANTLYRNNGDGTFVISQLSLSVALSNVQSAGTMFVDYDNDGWKDLYVLNKGANTLFRNEQGLSFTDVTAEAGVGDDGIGSTGAWADYDGDGFLDLYVGNFQCGGCPAGDEDGLYHNNGDGTFTDVSDLLVGQGSEPVENTFVGSFLDYDNDDDLDLYVVYDHEIGNRLWRNDGAGCASWCFTEVSASAGADTQVDGMGLAIGDYDNDGDLDMYFSDAVPAAVLLQNQTAQGSPTFIDVTVPAGLDLATAGWGALFSDCDNDGWLDIYLATTGPAPDLSNRLYHNAGDGTFTDISATSGADNGGPSLGVASGDYDNDGWVDLVVGNQNDRFYLYRNQGLVGQNNNWLKIRLEGWGDVNRDAVGSRVYVELYDGRTLMQEVKNGSSLGSGNDLALHFGLGQSSAKMVTIIWPDGETVQYNEVTGNQIWTIYHPSAPLTMYFPAVFK